VSLSPDVKPSPLRLGEMFFNDASLCFQGWQSCASCHSDDARVDGLNWDLLNDGIGNPKNVKSLLWSYITPPAMSLGVRDTAHTATRSGLRYILFASPPGEVAASLDAWLTSLSPLPSPHLVEGRLGEAARRGKKLFESKQTGCATCHAGTLFTDLKAYDVGTAGAFDHPGDAFDTPTLAECWRTAPYLHDGSAATLLDVLTQRNPQDRHGRTQQLTDAQRRDLAAYLLSL